MKHNHDKQSRHFIILFPLVIFLQDSSHMVLVDESPPKEGA